MSLISHQTFGSAHLVKDGHHFFEVRRAPVIYYLHAAEINALLLGGRANLCFVSQQRNPGHAIASADSGGYDGPRIVSFR
jgi:hypothetical protein